MKIVPLGKSQETYSCNSYLILGDWNRIEDVNTVIDPGVDGFIMEEIARLSTGFGKVPVQQVILTHNHFDHSAGAAALRKAYGCRVLAFQEGPGVDQTLKGGQFLKAGDDFLEVLQTPGHSSDSISLYAPSLHALFSGDLPLRVRTPGGSFGCDYLAALQILNRRKIDLIYSGHDEPLLSGGGAMIEQTIRNVLASRISG
ncbi:beta-lactamase [Geoanaerobacter pelophilus]|uniref:Beta-lactamase n=1 Tax=Geoanaerobacter pelophilus TaxID=60036 RepID=A0ABQ0MIV8_9BACT|nr:MBL fold metallo-hydrolase [Geoanaerobacter pelophilus]GAW67031.1 beta-lactamase [Geoanaerobacter pelophilus]